MRRLRPLPGGSMLGAWTFAAALLLTVIASCGDGASPTRPSSIAPRQPVGAAPSSTGLWMSRQELTARPTSGPAWANLLAAAEQPCPRPNLSNQDDRANVCVMAKALVFARTGTPGYRDDVLVALGAIANSGTYPGRALALGRELAAYVIAADLVDLRSADPALDGAFRAKLAELRTTATVDGPDNLVACHEKRPNNWGTNCGATRAAIAVYLGDAADLARTAEVFRGWLGDRASYAGFTYGDLSWQCDPARPVGINPPGCVKDGHTVDGVLPDDQRRGGGFRWPPPKEPYVWGALQGAVPLAVILQRAGYDAFNWQDRALLRAFEWLHTLNHFPAEGDDTWLPHLLNHYYGTSFPAPVPSRAGKNVGWADWTHGF